MKPHILFCARICRLLCLFTAISLLAAGCTPAPAPASSISTAKTSVTQSVQTAPLSITGRELSAKTRVTSAYFSTVSMCLLYDDYSIAGAEAALDAAFAQIQEILGEIEAAVSTSIPTSDIARFNTLAYMESMPISSHTANILFAAQRAYEITDGIYDPTIFPLVDIWGFSPRVQSPAYVPTMLYDRAQAGTLPDAAYINAFLGLVDFSGILLSGNEATGYTLTKAIPPLELDGMVFNAQLDLGGVAKGYATERVVQYLRESGYQYGYFVCGGSSIGLMECASERAMKDDSFAFNLTMKKPRRTSITSDGYASVRVKNAMLSTSGDDTNRFIFDDKVYCHIIDTQSGYPVNTQQQGAQSGIASVTVIGQDATYLDCLSTALMAMPPQDAIDFINEKLRDRQVILVLYRADRAYYEIVTNIPEADLQIIDPAYLPASELDENGALRYTGSLLFEE
ncbi:FAD:protein FMN transferase [Christensenellaceae bacterium OttesenSCG-928-M15]|nr:FAD:protein FMN transferase [Christensenellaceae bacterium OttesenSCG-928-M15]